MNRELLRHPEYFVQFGFVYAYMFASRALPLDWMMRLSEWAGDNMERYTRRGFRTGVENVMAAYPGMTQEAATRLIRRVYRHFARASAEMALVQRKLGRGNCEQHVTVRGLENVRRVQREGKGAICITAHLGPWEMLGLMLSRWGIRSAMVYRPVANPLVDRLMRRWREGLGQELIERRGAVPVLLRTLRRGGYIALAADQHVRRDGVAVPFFGRPAMTTMAPAMLAFRTGAPIIVGWSRRLPGLYRFEVTLEEPIYADRNAERGPEVLRLTAEMTRRIENAIRRQPDQWLWMHRRWRENEVKERES